MTTAATTTTTSNLASICGIEDIFHRHLVVFFTPQDAARLELTSSTLRSLLQASWRILCERDFASSAAGGLTAPVWNPQRNSFDSLQQCNTWKQVYQQWYFWQTWTAGGARAEHLLQAIPLWTRCRRVLQDHQLDNILRSLSPCLDRESCRALTGRIPSSLMAFYSVHGGQELLQARSQDHEFFAGLFGSYACYHNYYSMRLLKMAEFRQHAIDILQQQHGQILIAMSPGNPRTLLFLQPTQDDPEGLLMYNNGESVIGRGGILQYFQTYVEHLEAGVYKPAQIIEESPSARGMGVFPDAGPLMSSAVTRGIEVRASARWFPMGPTDEAHGLNFGYSIRIQMLLPLNENNSESCQLVGRHWEFMDANGTIRRVDGEAVVGKQPLFFRTNGQSGYIDLGPAGDGNRYENKVFVYQSQSGPVQGTTPQNTGQACVRGTFSFRPGSIDNPTGPIFHVTVASFPLAIPSPFY